LKKKAFEGSPIFKIENEEKNKSLEDIEKHFEDMSRYGYCKQR